MVGRTPKGVLRQRFRLRATTSLTPAGDSPRRRSLHVYRAQCRHRDEYYIKSIDLQDNPVKPAFRADLAADEVRLSSQCAILHGSRRQRSETWQRLLWSWVPATLAGRSSIISLSSAGTRPGWPAARRHSIECAARVPWR